MTVICRHWWEERRESHLRSCSLHGGSPEAAAGLSRNSNRRSRRSRREEQKKEKQEEEQKKEGQEDKEEVWLCDAAV